MYFKGLAEKCGVAPDYIIEYFNKFRTVVIETAKLDFRKILGSNTHILAFKDSPQEIKDEIEFVQNYIMSQQWSILKDRVPYERSLCVVKTTNDTSNIPNRYINRIGENIVLVLNGSVTLKSAEFPEEAVLNTGEIWRYNSRIPMEYTYSPDFYGLIISYVDFDLAHYLMPFDVHGMMLRRRDEYHDYDPNDESHKLDKVSTNDY